MLLERVTDLGNQKKESENIFAETRKKTKKKQEQNE